jgi:hypothetical protein
MSGPAIAAEVSSLNSKAPSPWQRDGAHLTSCQHRRRYGIRQQRRFVLAARRMSAVGATRLRWVATCANAGLLVNLLRESRPALPVLGGHDRFEAGPDLQDGSREDLIRAICKAGQAGEVRGAVGQVVADGRR